MIYTINSCMKAIASHIHKQFTFSNDSNCLLCAPIVSSSEGATLEMRG